jgi:FAD/FMN-containing dehydrogenase
MVRVYSMDDIAKQLAEIVGEQFVSNHPEERFIYSRDPGTMEPSYPDLVVMPDTTEQVQQIVFPWAGA